MSKCLLLQFKGPLQSWGADSRYGIRQTHHVPTKSGTLGLLAAAQGRRRSDSLEDLVALDFGVRVDQPGSLLRDYQTAIDWNKQSNARLSQRYYLADALFVVSIGGEEQVLRRLEDAVRAPVFPLYLGRRNCPVSPDLVIGIRDGDVEEVLRSQPWMASQRHKKTRPKTVELPLYRDALQSEIVEERVRDIPVSFDQTFRDYRWRTVTSPAPVNVENEFGTVLKDPFWEAVIDA
ncbi:MULTISPECIES: type I-E CRISPR-associated protein Cas5/CasD [Auritidibacter]|uniref:type I-E CRISPR-associated protein Cas5/CasD n=1 Tax=Auritidibacter TaxID=1160973 RepID=UPI000D72884F|nr:MULTISPECIES: type I-E CRISPR-associated protein Cas5/CasD [Auritidibacter]AXR74410.1 type I-E CRISPR-associated protein Cas5/CasD [Auritidibacter sp. NML130574]WGH83402.1 type I-E CRISPR-associated protein Cas5/CasD [Auritidibacter ignavus]WHS29195.1 type I-E CRISPR-associated protein Cas5/CasD [Auritidibacter ignavus]